MGGKHKQAQRIKNNARPSSSGRSAELLASSSQVPQFSSVKEIRFIPPTLSLMKTEEFDSSVSPAFQIVFKKMNKKDCTTKLKALQEFADLISNSEAEAVKTILAFWATLYGILAIDTDHRIREAAHNAHHQVILKDKKIIAPYLKQLIGPWFTSQYDNYPPAASAAAKAFNAAFPPNKIQDCVMFCQKEILTYIHDNLTSKIDSNLKHGSNDDAEVKYERIIISSLQGYCLYLNTLTDEQIQKNADLNQQIIGNSRFLKLGSHKTAIIRAMWFKVLAGLYHKAGFLLSEQHGHVVPVVFNNLDESEPAVVGFVWEAALLIMNLGQDWWKYIHIEKNYLAKLKKVLKEGGQGNATVIYPNLLSLLHKLPPTVKVEHFYDSFFENLRNGLKRKSVTISKSESAAIITALVECLQYVVLINQQNLELCEKLIKTHLLPVIEWSLNGDQTCYRNVFHQVALLVQYWNRNRNLENYPQYLDLFWKSVVGLFENLNGENAELADRHVTFLQYLKTVAKPKEQLKVKFSANESEVANEHQTQTATQIDETYNENLKVLVYAVLKSYVGLIQQKQLKAVLQHLFAVIHLFESEDFLSGLSKYVNDDQSESLIQIYSKLLYEWLKSPELCTETVVDLAFILLKYLDEDEKNVVLTSFLEFYECESFSWCLKNAFSHPHNQDPLVQNWIRNEKVGRFLVATTETNLKSNCPANIKSLFKLAFTEKGDGELLIDKITVAEIIAKLQLPLLHPKGFSSSIDSCARLASYVAEIIYTENTLLKCGEELLLALFQFCCSDHSDLENLTSDTQWEINTSWQDALTTLSRNLQKEELKNLTAKFATIIEENFIGNSQIENDSHLIDVMVNFIKAVFDRQPLMITDIFNLFFNRDFLPSWRGKITELCLEAEYLSGNLTNPSGSFKIGAEVSEENILKYFVWSFIKISVLSAPLQDKNLEEEDEDAPIDAKEIIYVIDDNPRLITELLLDLAAGSSFLNNYKMTKYFINITHYCDLIKEKTKSMLEKLQINDQIQDLLITQLNSESWLWCKAIYLLNQEITPSPLEDVYKNYLKQANNDLSRLHLSQIFGPHLDFDHIQSASGVLADTVILRSLLHCNEIDVQIAEVFEKIKKLRSKNIPKFLFESKDITWEESEEIIQVIRLFSKLITDKFECLNRQHWDFGVISLSSWASNCWKLRSGYHNEQIRALMVAVADFYVSLDGKMGEMKRNGVKSDFVEEWEDLFLPNIHTDLLQLFLYLSEEIASKQSLSIEYQPFLQEFGRIIDHFHHKLIFTKDNSLPNWSKILKRCSPLLVNSTSVLQLWGYKMLLILVPGLIDVDLQSNNSNTPNTKGLTFEQFKETLLHTQNIVNDLLVGFKLGEDSCQVAPFTDSYTYVFGYLLLWCVLLNLCEESSPELRYQYADSLRTDNFLKSLLNNLFKLMPTEILHYNEGKAKSFLKLFQKEPKLDFKEPCTSEQLEHVVCWVYAVSLTQLPALVRQWWSETETKVTQIVEKVTAFYVSPQLCNQELLDVAHHETKFKNMTIKTIPSVREVIAIYTVDEAQMELVIALPQNYPLGGPDVGCNRQIGGPLHKQWLMQLKKCLLHQNGRIWDGLSLWNNNLDKKFDGVEECYICFAVLHPGTYQLPRLSCQTCKKKFHSACLCDHHDQANDYNNNDNYHHHYYNNYNSYNYW
ncbi:E3 ubiquitin-protein ligase listerin [Asbolus verrucosus]|uniref:E3 ubiquitin-protein ligase listerin n=1 Tax=Asbolus verrucosus TaxID=1661398 RepID=A0A482WAM8_ASBVE|nr:E3 ubiquitin-protein ligase listerin [Asbolus verrucosus]